MHYKALGKTGLRVSEIGFGASPFGNVFQEVGQQDCQAAVDAAVAGGINFFDVSPYYGLTLAEERLGQTLVGKRQSVLLATKCGRYGAADFDFSGPRIRLSLDESLKRLRTDYIDLFQAHDIEFGDERQIADELIPTLLELKEQGKVRFVGITGYQLRMMARLADRFPLDNVLSYCRWNLLIDDMDLLLTPTAKRLEIGLVNASPLHMGLLTVAGPPPWHPAPDSVREAAREVVQLCLRHNLKPEQVGLRFCLSHPYAATTLVGMATVEQVQANLRALEVELEPDLMHQIEELLKPAKNVVWDSGRPGNADYQSTGKEDVS